MGWGGWGRWGGWGGWGGRGRGGGGDYYNGYGGDRYEYGKKDYYYDYDSQCGGIQDCPPGYYFSTEGCTCVSLGPPPPFPPPTCSLAASSCIVHQQLNLDTCACECFEYVLFIPGLPAIPDEEENRRPGTRRTGKKRTGTKSSGKRRGTSRRRTSRDVEDTLQEELEELVKWAQLCTQNANVLHFVSSEVNFTVHYFYPEKLKNEKSAAGEGVDPRVAVRELEAAVGELEAAVAVVVPPEQTVLSYLLDQGFHLLLRY